MNENIVENPPASRNRSQNCSKNSVSISDKPGETTLMKREEPILLSPPTIDEMSWTIKRLSEQNQQLKKQNNALNLQIAQFSELFKDSVARKYKKVETLHQTLKQSPFDIGNTDKYFWQKMSSRITLMLNNCLYIYIEGCGKEISKYLKVNQIYIEDLNKRYNQNMIELLKCDERMIEKENFIIRMTKLQKKVQEIQTQIEILSKKVVFLQSAEKQAKKLHELIAEEQKDLTAVKQSSHHKRHHHAYKRRSRSRSYQRGDSHHNHSHRKRHH